MAGKGGSPVARILRIVVLLGVLGGSGWLIWREMTKKEGYAGGNVETTGTVDADHVRLAFKVGGRLAAVPVREGDRVKTGDVVGRIDAADFEMQLRAARVALLVAKANAQQAQAVVDRATRDDLRMRRLAAGDAATEQQLEQARSAKEIAQAQRVAASAQVKQAETAVAQAELTLSYCVLRAPQPGQVTERVRLPGEMIAAGSPVVTIAQLDTVKVVAAVDETRVGAVRPGDKVRVRVYTFDRRTFEGVVTDVAAAGDFATRKDWGAQRRDIRTFAVDARVLNPGGLLKDGMTAEVTIVVDTTLRRAAAEAK